MEQKKILWVHPDYLPGRESRKEMLNHFMENIAQDDTDGKDFYEKKDLSDYDLVIIRGLFLRELNFEEIITLQKNIEQAKVRCVVDSINDSFLKRAVLHGFDVVPRGDEKTFFKSMFERGSTVGYLKRISSGYLESRFQLREMDHRRKIDALHARVKKSIFYYMLLGILFGFLGSYFIFL